jgi:hypothetical protein
MKPIVPGGAVVPSRASHPQRIKAWCAEIIETVDHVPSWSTAQQDAFVLGYVRGIRSIYRRDKDTESLLYAVNAGGVDVVRQIAEARNATHILKQHGPIKRFR